YRSSRLTCIWPIPGLSAGKRPSASGPFAQEILGRKRLNIRQCLEKLSERPVPPAECLQAFGNRLRKAGPDDMRRYTGNDHVRRDVPRHHGIGADNRTVAYRYTRHDHGAVADPHVIADRHPLRPASFPESLVHAAIAEIFVRPVAHLMGRRALHRMLQRIDARVRRDRAELTDLRVNAFGIALEIGEVPYLHLAQDHALRNRGIAAQPARLQLRRRVDAWLGIGETQVLHGLLYAAAAWKSKPADILATVCIFNRQRRRSILRGMKPAPANQPLMLAFAAAALSLAVIGGLGLAMWMDKGAALFLSLVEAGLAWCL